jgi:hypothetical protein
MTDPISKKKKPKPKSKRTKGVAQVEEHFRGTEFKPPVPQRKKKILQNTFAFF